MNILKQGLVELARAVVFQEDYTQFWSLMNAALCEPVRGMCCTGEGGTRARVAMNANKDGIVLLHPPRSQASEVSPQI